MKVDELGGFQYLEIRSSLPDELLMYGDKLSMAHSLEVQYYILIQRLLNMLNDYRQNLKSDLEIENGSTSKFVQVIYRSRLLIERNVDLQ